MVIGHVSVLVILADKFETESGIKKTGISTLADERDARYYTQKIRNEQLIQM